jgi:UDP-N-acetylmuramate--alanine ligase
LDPNARLGRGEILVAEADESDGSFRHLFPMVAVVTNIDREHLDHFGTEAALSAAFLDFADKVPFYGLVVIGADNPAAARLAPLVSKRHTTYGLTTGDWRGEILEAGPGGTHFRVRVRGKLHGEGRIRMPGVHHAGNALAALCVADFLGVPFAAACETLAGFEGVDRRFSVRGEVGSVLVVDDYGHHPTELAATVAAARLYGRRLVVAFQPHRFTRTRDLLGDFAPALAGADQLFITDIYAAGESPLPGIDTDALLATFPRDAAVRRVERGVLAPALADAVRAGDLVLCLGAGDITGVPTELLALLGARAKA